MITSKKQNLINIKNLKYSLLLGFLFSCLYYFLIFTQNVNLLAEMDLTLIPTTGPLAKAFRSGDFDFADLLLYGMYLIKLTATSAGVIYMIMNVYAGIKYITGGATGEKEAGKDALKMAFLGFALTVFAWIIVDIFIAFFTSGV